MAPLHAACIVGNIEICNILISSGAELTKSFDFKRFLPVHYAIVKDHEALICYFFEKLKLKLLDQEYLCNGHKLLTLAIQNGSYKIVKLLVNDYRADPMEKDA
jgi:ankyrin repeat protein